MKRPLFFLFGLVLSLSNIHASHAQIPLGTNVATYSITPAKILADPARDRLYVTDVVNNAVVVIDTTTLGITNIIPVGSNPGDMAISRDGSTLFVANRGSTAAAISVLDLSSLVVRGNYALPTAPGAIIAGLENRVYVSGNGAQDAIYQIDGITGAVQTSFNNNFYDNGFLQITPDGKTLLAGGLYSLRSFDVTTSTPVVLQTNSNAGDNASQLVISHNGQYVCLPSGPGNGEAGDYYTTFLFSTADLNAHFGEFNNGPYPGLLAFSPDDSVVYQNIYSSNTIQVFSTQSFKQLASFSPPYVGTYSFMSNVTSITTDRTGSYLCIGEQGSKQDNQGNTSSVGQLVVVATGTGPLAPPPPMASLEASVANVVADSGQTGAFTFTLSSAPFVDVKVAYRVKGTAVNGQDFAPLKGTVKIKAGKTSKTVKVTPLGDLDGVGKKTVVLTLQPGDGYTVSTVGKVKVKIFPAHP